MSFYVSDSFTLNPFQPGKWHYPGPANQNKVWLPGETVNIEVAACELGFVRYGPNPGPSLYAGLDYSQGINCDLLMCLYDVTPGGPNPAPPVIVNGQPVILKFDLNNQDGQIAHAVNRYGESCRSARNFSVPLKLKCVCPSVTGKQYQVGALFKFNSDPNGGSTLAYQYFLQGVCL